MVSDVSAMLVAMTILRRGGGREDALLIARAEPAEQRDDFRLAAEAAFELVARLADVPFARHEDQHVAGARSRKDCVRPPAPRHPRS